MIIFAGKLMNIKKHIPNAITCCNLICGCLAIIKVFDDNLILAAYLIGLAALFDFFDGFVARLLKVSSPIGKDLDSLADMVTFGVVPGLIMFKLISKFYFINRGLSFYAEGSASEIQKFGDTWSNFNSNTLLAYFGLLIPVFSAIRLAKFNNDSRQSESFIGLPTPANAILIGSIPLILNQQFGSEGFYTRLFENIKTNPSVYSIVFNPVLLCMLSCVLSLLLVSELPLFALKFKNFTWHNNKIRYVFLGISLVLIILLQHTGVALAIVLYILLSLINKLFQK